jgi:hypothetical protein
MAPIIPDRVPQHFPAGTSVVFTRTLDEYLPSDGWTYTIYLNGLTQKFSKAATVIEGNVFHVLILASETENLAPGPYRYCERVKNTNTGATFDLRGDELVINIEPDAATSPAGTFVTWEERTLAIVEAALSGRLTADIQSYQIAGRAVSKIPIQELRTIRGELKASIWRQENPGKLGQAYKVEFEEEDENMGYPPTWQDVTGFDR